MQLTAYEHFRSGGRSAHFLHLRRDESIQWDRSFSSCMTSQLPVSTHYFAWHRSSFPRGSLGTQQGLWCANDEDRTHRNAPSRMVRPSEVTKPVFQIRAPEPSLARPIYRAEAKRR
jgi:hypothetical protein